MPSAPTAILHSPVCVVGGILGRFLDTMINCVQLVAKFLGTVINYVQLIANFILSGLLE